MKVLSNTGAAFGSKQLQEMTADDIFFGFDDTTPCVRVFDAPGLAAGDAAMMRLTDNHIDYVAGSDLFRLVIKPAGVVL